MWRRAIAKSNSNAYANTYANTDSYTDPDAYSNANS